MKKRVLQILFLFFLILSYEAFGQDLKVEIKASPNPATLQSTIVLQISVSGNTQSLPDIPRPSLRDFTIISGPSTSQSIQIINFKMTAVKTLSYQLIPKKTGTFVIGPVSVKFRGKTFKSNIVKLIVQKGSAVAGKKQSSPLFLKVDIPDKSVYLYQPVPVTFKLYLRGRVRSNSLQLIEEPDFNGFWVEEVKDKSQPYYEMVGNKRFEVYPIYQKMVFPVRTGEISIKPMRVSVDFLVKSRQTTDPFGFFDDFDDFFGNYTTRKMIASSEVVNLNVKPLPPVDSDISPLVGLFQLSTNAREFTGRVADAITLVITLEGNGYLGSLEKLPITFPASFEVYEPKIRTWTNISGAEYHVKKRFEYILIPREEGKYTTEIIKIPMFDYKTEKYKWLTIPSFSFNVAENPNAIPSMSTFASGGTTGLKDIRYIKTTYEKLKDISSLSSWRNIWVILLILNILFLAVLLYARQWLIKNDTDVAYARSRKARKIATKRLKEAKRYLVQKNSDAFAEEIYKAITTFISDRLHLENKSLTTEEVCQVLSQKNIPDESLNEITRILQMTETIRFAPSHDIEQAMEGLYKDAENAIVGLQKYI